MPDRSASPDLDARYGRSARRRPPRILLAIGLAVLLAAVAFVGVRFAHQPARVTTVAYEHAGPGSITVTFQLSGAPDRAMHCTAQALDAARAQVGFAAVDLPPRGERDTMHEVTITTQGDAVAAEVIGCEPA